MNAPFDQAQALAPLSIPPEFQALAPLPLLLPGESLEQYQRMVRAIVSEIAPRSAIEWLIVIDVIELSWDIRRYRMLRHKVLENHRQQAIERTLARIDGVGIPPSFEENAEFYLRINALSWRVDKAAADEIEARLATFGFDANAISAEVFGQAREIYLTFEHLLAAAQSRRIQALREIDHFRRVRRSTFRPLSKPVP